MSGAMIAIIVVVAVVVLGGGCATCLCVGVLSKKKPAATAAPAPEKPTKTPAPSHGTGERWITVDRPYVKFHAPNGWANEITQDKEWDISRSPARDGVFAFTTFTQPGESTIRLGKADSVLGVTNIDWRTPRGGVVGRDKFDARIADGSCNFHGPGGYTWYATVNTGTSDQILIIYALSANAPPARRAEVQAALDSLQRR
jgi:hypothetical protein